MVFQFHRDEQAQFEQQRGTATRYIIPFIEQVAPVEANMRVLEIGCGEGGVLMAFLERGCQVTGIELDSVRVERARRLLREALEEGQANVLEQDVHEIDSAGKLGGRFDLIILKDVIEHVRDQETLLKRLAEFLKPTGAIFVSFPPWRMPFGGHQQVCRHTLLSVTPYIHLLPGGLYRWVLKRCGEPEHLVAELLELRETGISLGRFQRLLRRTGYTIARRTLYLLNPIYEYKFGLKPMEQFRLVAGMPYIRDFLTSCGYYLVRPEAGTESRN